MESYTVAKGDALWHPIAEESILVHPHIVNNVDAWGSGFAMDISEKWPEPEQKYHQAHPMTLGDTQLVKVENNRYVFNMCAQNETIHTNGMPIDLRALDRCLVKLEVEAASLQRGKVRSLEVHAPKFGADRAIGDWIAIEKLTRLRLCQPDSGVTWTYIYEETKHK